MATVTFRFARYCIAAIRPYAGKKTRTSLVVWGGGGPP